MVLVPGGLDRPALRPDLIEHATQAAAGHLTRLSTALRLVPIESVGRAARLLLAARAEGQRVYVMGNGGSAATASHLVCDLVKTAQLAKYRPLRVISLTDCVPLLTAWANDTDYGLAFANQIASVVDDGDVVIAISASGKSPNIVNGLRAAAQGGARTIALVGFDGGEAATLADVTIHVASTDYGLVEDAHSAVCHALTAAIKSALLADAVGRGRAAASADSPAPRCGRTSVLSEGSDHLY